MQWISALKGRVLLILLDDSCCSNRRASRVPPARLYRIILVKIRPQVIDQLGLNLNCPPLLILRLTIYLLFW